MYSPQKQSQKSQQTNPYGCNNKCLFYEQIKSLQVTSQIYQKNGMNEKIDKIIQQKQISFNTLLSLKYLIANVKGQEKYNKINNKINKFLSAYVFSDILIKIIKNNYKRYMQTESQKANTTEKIQRNKQKYKEKGINKNQQLTKITEKDQDSQSMEQNSVNLYSLQQGVKCKKPMIVIPCKVIKIGIWKQNTINTMFNRNPQHMSKIVNIITDIQQSPYSYEFIQQKIPILITPLNRQQLPKALQNDISQVITSRPLILQNIKKLKIQLQQDQRVSLKKSKSIGPHNKQIKQRLHAVRKTRSPLQKQRKSINFGNDALQFKNSLIKQRQQWKEKANIENQIQNIKLEKGWTNQMYSRRIVKLRNKKIQNKYQTQQYLYCAEPKIIENQNNNHINQSISLQVKNILNKNDKMVVMPQNQENQTKYAFPFYNSQIKQSNASTNIKSDQNNEQFKINKEENQNMISCTIKKDIQYEIITNKFTRHKSHSLSLTSPKNIQNIMSHGMKQISVCNSPQSQSQNKIQVLRNKKRKSLNNQIKQFKCNNNINFDCLHNFPATKLDLNLNSQSRNIYKTSLSFSRPHQWKNSLINMRDEQVSLSSSFQQPIKAYTIQNLKCDYNSNFNQSYAKKYLSINKIEHKY